MSGGFAPRLKRESLGVGGEVAFLASEDYTVKRAGVTLKASAVTADEDGNKILPLGTLVTPDVDGQYVPYSGATEEVQTITYGGSGLTSYTLTFDGQTTGSIAAAATAGQIQSALEALSNVDPGDVVVTGSGSPFSVKFQGQYEDTNVPQMTATPTGGTGTVTIATATAGGAPGAPALDDDTSGYLLESYNLKDGDEIAGIVIRGSVLAARVHPAPDATTRAALKGRIIFQ